jgi:hypothetical protein
VKNGQTQDCPVLPVDAHDFHYPNVPELQVFDTTNGEHDFNNGSALGVVIPAGGTRLFLAMRENIWTTADPPVPTSETFVVVTPARVGAGSVPGGFEYKEEELYPPGSPLTKYSDGNSKGRRLSLGLPTSLAVTAAARLGADGMVVAGHPGGYGPAWVVTLDASFAPINQGAFTAPMGSGVTTPASVAVDAAANIYLCGNSVPHPPFAPSAWIAQAAPDLTGWATLAMPGSVYGCAMTSEGVLVVTGRYSGTFNGQTSNGGTDLYLARVTPGSGGSAPALASFAHHGSTSDEPIISAPLIASDGAVVVAGVTTGNWGRPPKGVRREVRSGHARPEVTRAGASYFGTSVRSQVIVNLP